MAGKGRDIGQVILIDHSGKPVVWPVKKSGNNDLEHLSEIFETAIDMCGYELAMGGTLKLFDSHGNLLREQRGRAS